MESAIARGRYTPPTMSMLAWVAGLLLLWAPGAAIDLLLDLQVTRDRLVKLAIRIGIGMAFWPVLFLWTSTLGVRISSGMTRTIAGLALAVAVGIPALRILRGRAHGARFRRPSIYLVCFLFVALLTVATRVVQIRELVLPAWVDPVHHTMITALLLEHGSIPETYSPYIEGGRFYYHWGFHSLLAFLAWTLGATEPFQVTNLMLHFGQLLNALIVLMMYAGGRILFASRASGLVAAMLAALVSFFPAYYVSWGRYTHLAGILLLIPFGIVLWRVARRWSIRHFVALSILGAGLLLTHVRVAFFALTFAIALSFLTPTRHRMRALLSWSLAAVAILLLTSPWLIRLTSTREVHYVVAPSTAESETTWQQAKDVQWDVVWSPNNRLLFMLASAGLATLATWETTPVWLKFAAILWWASLVGIAEWYWRHRRTRSRKPLRRSIEPWTPLVLLAFWCLLTMALLNLDRIGLPSVTIATNHSAVISLFVPLSLAAAGLLGWVLETMVRFGSRRIALVILVGGGALFATPSMFDIVNPVTILARADDVRMIRWLDANLPESAAFVIPVQPWQGGAWIGADGGYWISVLTRRRTIVPPALYAWSVGDADSAELRHLLEEFTDATEIDAALVGHLRASGFTHLYLGANSRDLAEDLRTNPHLKLLHQEGQAQILELHP